MNRLGVSGEQAQRSTLNVQRSVCALPVSQCSPRGALSVYNQSNNEIVIYPASSYIYIRMLPVSTATTVKLKKMGIPRYDERNKARRYFNCNRNPLNYLNATRPENHDTVPVNPAGNDEKSVWSVTDCPSTAKDIRNLNRTLLCKKRKAGIEHINHNDLQEVLPLVAQQPSFVASRQSQASPLDSTLVACLVAETAEGEVRRGK